MTALITLLIIAALLQIVGAALAVPDVLDARRSATALEDHSRNLEGMRLGLYNLPGGENSRTDAVLDEMTRLLREIAGADRVASNRALFGAGLFAAGTLLASLAAIIAVA